MVVHDSRKWDVAAANHRPMYQSVPKGKPPSRLSYPRPSANIPSFHTMHDKFCCQLETNTSDSFSVVVSTPGQLISQSRHRTLVDTPSMIFPAMTLQAVSGGLLRLTSAYPGTLMN